MSRELPGSIPGVVEVEVLRGADAPAGAIPELLVEVPHGADRRAHYDALRARLQGALPEGLERFFHVNTDVGAWQFGRATAEAVLAAAPRRSALLLRCLVPRTFVDCNRPADCTGSDLTQGGVTAGIPAYVHDDRDRALLLELHRAYVQAAEAAYRAVCGAGGVALVPHTYAPRSVGISKVEDDIVDRLRWAYEPDRYATWVERAEVDLLTRDGEGRLLAPAGVEERLIAAFSAVGLTAKTNDTYYLHPSTLGHGWSVAYPGQLVCLEVRRDLLVETWRPFEEMDLAPAGVERVAGVLAPALEELLARCRAPGGLTPWPTL